jgi:carbon starvation protein
MLQDLLGSFVPALKRTESWVANLVATALTVGAWGYFLHQGVVDPLGGINTLWPLFGISNQMLAAVALTLGTVVLFRMKKERYAWVTIAPAAWLVVCTLTAGWQKIFSPDPKVGFLSHASKYADALAAGQLLAPAKSADAMSRIVFNDRLDAVLCALFMAVVVSVLVYGVRASLAARAANRPTASEVPFEAMPAAASAR